MRQAYLLDYPKPGDVHLSRRQLKHGDDAYEPIGFYDHLLHVISIPDSTAEARERYNNTDGDPLR